MKRVLVIGSGGSGKSTFSRELAEILGLPLIHLDQLYWRAGWEKPTKDRWEKQVKELIAQPAWIMDGNFAGTFPQRLKRADTIVLLDLPRVVCLWRALRRQVKYRGRTRPDMADGCPEHFSWEYLAWIWRYPSKSLPDKIERLDRTNPDQRVAILDSRRAVREFLDETRREVELRRLSEALAAQR